MLISWPLMCAEMAHISVVPFPMLPTLRQRQVEGILRYQCSAEGEVMKDKVGLKQCQSGGD